MNVSVIIVTYNGMKWIGRTISSLLKSSINMQIIIVDNNSIDGTIDYLSSLENHVNIKVFTNKKNLGFGKANNIGIKKALEQGADYVFLLNQDVYIKKDTITKLLKASKENSDFGILSPVHFNGEGDELDYTFSDCISHRKNKRIFRDAILGELKSTYEVPFVNAAAWFISSTTIKKIGGFDSLFSHYGEDHNYIQRLKYFRYKIGVVTDSFIYHDREEREKLRVKDYSTQHKENHVRWIMITLADINKDDFDSIFAQEKSYLLKAILKHAILFKGKELKWSLDMLLTLKGIRSELVRSREINKQSGLNHLG